MPPAIVHPTTGLPVKSAPANPRHRAGLSGDYARAFPYDAANVYHRETEGWYPQPYSPDYEYNIYRDRIVARSRDLARNDGWASGGIQKILDATIGAHWRFVSKPDYRALSYFNKAFDAVWARDFRHAVEARWRSFSEDPNLYCDATRQLNFAQMMRLALRHKLVDGENLIVNEWMPERLGYGGAQYATCFRVVDPDRLSNPYDRIDTLYQRGGIDIDEDGVPLAYNIREAHQYDWYGAVQSMIWQRMERETDWGRRIVIHDYDRERADQHRGVPLMAPVMNRMKMLAKYDQAELQAAILNAILSIAVTSPHDPEGLREAATTTEAGNEQWYWQTRKHYRDERPLHLSEAQVMALFPGEDITPIQAERPGSAHDPFTHYALRNVAAQLGTTAEEMTLDWSKANYSSARAGMIIGVKTAMRRRGDFASNTSMQCVVAWMEELFEDRQFRDVLPKGGSVPGFLDARAAYSRGHFLGPGKGYIDQVKEKQGMILGMDAGVSTLQHECAEQGFDWEENLDQRQLEVEEFKKRGLPLPDWVGVQPAYSTDEKPKAD